jgi:predicted transcriptional regulator
MPRSPRLPDLSRSELDVMKVLWSAPEGRLSAREVHDQLAGPLDWAYSTTRTVLDRMAKKSLLDRQSFHGVLLYAPRISRPLGLARMVRDFAERVLELDHGAVVPLFARSEALTADEVEELARLLDEAHPSNPDPGDPDGSPAGGRRREGGR